ncbi:Uma2 family endonuclease [Nocardia sp. CC227C]|uniref:Uma2 family endonuclease n=1 Tax=Nocardia sp. CC227C TaxID=3044562 RepID=UPI00278C29A8|nr:Uma2 family endonuclease [Nocardia sp. CC227C]
MTRVLDWARPENLQPEPITLDIWKQLPHEFRRLVEVVNGDAVRADKPTLAQRNAARRLSSMLETGAEKHMNRYNDGWLFVATDLDVLLWDLPRVTVRRPDVALFCGEPSDFGPMPAARIKIAVEVVSPATERVDTADKTAEYALAGIPWYWLVRMDGERVASIDIHVLVLRQYRLHKRLRAEVDSTLVEMPIEIRVDWHRLTGLLL